MIVSVLEDIMVEITLMHRLRSPVSKVGLVQIFEERKCQLLNLIQPIYFAWVFALNKTSAHLFQVFLDDSPIL
jgi:hypothetical protein